MTRRRYVMRCTECDAVPMPDGASTYPCPECGKWTRISMPAEEAPSLEVPQGRLMVFGESHYDGMAATDGTPIDSKRKHRDYMKANGLAMTADFSGQWQKQAAQRANGPTPVERRERKEQIGRAAYRLRQKRSR